jgi:hypothetical protein
MFRLERRRFSLCHFALGCHDVFEHAIEDPITSCLRNLRVTREVFVLGRKEGVDDLFWDRLDRYKNTTLGGIFGQQAAIPGMNAGHDSRLVMRELLVVRQLAVELCDRDADNNATGDR